MRPLGLSTLVLSLGGWFWAVGLLPAQDADLQRAINRAIDRGVEYLKKQQKENGSWDRQGDPGATTMAAWTLLESGVARDDPALVKAADFIRASLIRETKNYNLSLGIIFLDKLGDSQDIPLIEALAMRLLAGQTQFGGWAYSSPEPTDREVARLTRVLAQRKPGQVKGPAPKRGIISLRHFQQLDPDIRAQWQVLANRKKDDLMADPGDNSNTQFAMIALWVARRYGIPVEGALAFVDWRFRNLQWPDGHWPYDWAPPSQGPSGHPTTPAMTCAGLLGLALGHATFVNRGLKRDLSGDPSVRKGMAYIANVLQKGYKDPPDPVLPGNKIYYFLWSLERMAVVYDVKLIGNVDWYVWGAKQLVASQTEAGAWQGAFALGDSDTCFALLFLKKVNVVEDLTDNLKKNPTKGPTTKTKEPPPVDLTPFIPKENKKPGGTKRIPTDDQNPGTKKIPEIDPKKPNTKKIPEAPQGWLQPSTWSPLASAPGGEQRWLALQRYSIWRITPPPQLLANRS